MKQRVNRCLLRLSDRDTEAMAAAELDAIARELDADELPVFVAAVSDARPTDRTPLRRHSLRLLALVAGEHPRGAVAPLVNTDQTALVERLARESTAAGTLAAIRHVSSAADDIRRNATPQLALEAMLLSVKEDLTCPPSSR